MSAAIYAGHIRAAEWEVRPVPLALARRLVEAHHYAGGGSNTATYAHGLFPCGTLWEADCKGVAWWIPPTKGAALKSYPPRWQGVLSLTRMVILPGAPKGSATFLLRRSMLLIDRTLWPCLVTYADTWRGHTGAIYKVASWEYVGLTEPQPVYTRNGKMVARKAGPRTRTHAEMIAMGCVLEGRFPKHKYRHLTKGARREQRTAEQAAGKEWTF